MADVTFTIDEQTVTAPEGQRLLWAAEAAGISIPHLCAHPDKEPPSGACRLCYVEVEGKKDPVTSCTEPVREGMVVHTRTERVDRLVRSAHQLLMSTHELDCKPCPGKRFCGLRSVSRMRKIGLKSGDLPKVGTHIDEDTSHPRYGLNPNHCILCGLCVWACEEKVGKGILHFAGRGIETHISTFDGRPLAEQDCTDECDACADICPTGALYIKPEVLAEGRENG